MGSNNNKEQELFDVPKDQTIEGSDKIVVSAQREDNRASITGRPNINEISKRNEKEEKRNRRSFYRTTGIIVLLIIVFMFLVYFFS